MNAISKFICLGVLAALCAVPAVTLAAKCSGTNINNLVSWEPTEIAKGTTLAIMRITSVTVSDDPSAAYHLSWFWGYSDYIKGVGRAWGYAVWILEDGNKIFSEYSGNSNTQPTGSGAAEGTYHGTGRLTGGTGKYKGIRGTLTDAVEFNTDPTSGYNRGNSKGEYWFVE